MVLARYFEDCDLRGIAALVRGELDSEGRRSRLPVVGEATLTSFDKKLGPILHRSAADPDYLLLIYLFYDGLSSRTWS